MATTNLALEAFLTLRSVFAGRLGVGTPFTLPLKGNTQDDPLDTYIADVLSSRIRDASCIGAPGPLTSPDMVLKRQRLCERVPDADLRNAPDRIIGIEVKKIERTSAGQVARSTGLDYNSTPPCGTIRVYRDNDEPLEIRAFYLFVCAEPREGNMLVITSLALCDGDLLNDDFDLYMSRTGQREKTIALGTYGDGCDRNRPMLIFANPLGSPELDRSYTLVTAKRLPEDENRVRLWAKLGRKTRSGQIRWFYCYRDANDVCAAREVSTITDPFPTPQRSTATQPRGKFHVGL